MKDYVDNFEIKATVWDLLFIDKSINVTIDLRKYIYDDIPCGKGTVIIIKDLTMRFPFKKFIPPDENILYPRGLYGFPKRIHYTQGKIVNYGSYGMFLMRKSIQPNDFEEIINNYLDTILYTMIQNDNYMKSNINITQKDIDATPIKDIKGNRIGEFGDIINYTKDFKDKFELLEPLTEGSSVTCKGFITIDARNEIYDGFTDSHDLIGDLIEINDLIFKFPVKRIEKLNEELYAICGNPRIYFPENTKIKHYGNNGIDSIKDITMEESQQITNCYYNYIVKDILDSGHIVDLIGVSVIVRNIEKIEELEIKKAINLREYGTEEDIDLPSDFF